MQASKSREDVKHYDTFQCHSCQTTIVEAELPPSGHSRPK